MTIKMGVTAVAAVMLLAGCARSEDGTDAAGESSSTSKAASESSTASSPEGGDAPAKSPSYDHPADMMEKATAKLPYLVCDEDVPQRDIDGALGLSCTGRTGESVSFDVYKTGADLMTGTESKEQINAGSQYYAGETWTVSAEEDRTLADLQRVLDPKNAPKVTALTVSQAKREYQRMVKPINDATGDLDYLDEEYSEVSEFNTTCSSVDLAMDTFVAELEFAAWPAAVDSKMPALVKDVESDQKQWTACAEATSIDSVTTALDGLSGDQTAANNVRTALGLDAASTN